MFSELEYLESRLAELEFAANNLAYSIENEDSVMYQDPFYRDNLTKVLTESAAVRRRIAEVKLENKQLAEVKLES